MDTNTILVIISAVLTGAGLLLGGKYAIIKTKFNQLKVVAKEGYEAVKVTIDAVADDKITPEEFTAIKKESGEAWAAVKALLGIGKE